MSSIDPTDAPGLPPAPRYSSLLTTQATMSSIDPTNEATAPGVPPAPRSSSRSTDEPSAPGVPPAPRYSSLSSHGGLIPLVLQVSPLDNCPGQDEFFYDPFASVESGDFAAARAFFINYGHVVVFHDCPDAMSFQALYPLATIGYISLLPAGLLAEGIYL